MGLGVRLGAAWRGLVNRDGGPGAKNADGLGSSALAALLRVYGSNESKSGQSVTAATALGVSTVLACARVLADGIAQVPLKLYREREDGRGSDQARDHPLYDVLHRRPNGWQTSFLFRETMMFHLVLCGNFFAFKNRVGRAGEIRELVPIEPGRVEVRRNPDLSLSYFVRGEDGRRAEFSQESIWHIRGPSWNSWMGMESVNLAREAIGLTMAIETDQARLYKNGLRTSGLYSVEGTLNQEQHELIREWIDQNLMNDEAHRPLIMDRSAKFTPFGITGTDAQTLESRKFQVEDICRAFRVLPIMVGFSENNTSYASVEQMFIAHKVHTLAPHGERIEQAIDNDLLTGADRDAGYYAKFNFEGLMRGAAKDQSEYFSKALGAGGAPAWLTQNEVRAYLELNPIDGGDGLPKPTNPAPADPAKELAAEEG